MAAKRAPSGSEGQAGGSSGRPTAKRVRKSRVKPRFHGYTEGEIARGASDALKRITTQLEKDHARMVARFGTLGDQMAKEVDSLVSRVEERAKREAGSGTASAKEVGGATASAQDEAPGTFDRPSLPLDKLLAEAVADLSPQERRTPIPAHADIIRVYQHRPAHAKLKEYVDLLIKEFTRINNAAAKENNQLSGEVARLTEFETSAAGRAAAVDLQRGLGKRRFSVELLDGVATSLLSQQHLRFVQHPDAHAASVQRASYRIQPLRPAHVEDRHQPPLRDHCLYLVLPPSGQRHGQQVRRYRRL